MRIFTWLLFSTAILSQAGKCVADEASSQPRPVPLTRPEMKEYLEDMKGLKPRFPLPELTEEGRVALGERADSYESRLRYHYSPRREDQNRNFGQQERNRGQGGFAGGQQNSDPKMTLSYRFKTQLFWIVSRTNNCQY